MTRAPTYVIGLGRTGANTIAALDERLTESDLARNRFGLMAVSTDIPPFTSSQVTPLQLESDTGVVGEAVAEFPFLTSDDIIPQDGADNLRHVGRYKLDNPSSPTFSHHQQTIQQELDHFIESQQWELTSSRNVCRVVIVSSLADGVGSGTLLQITAMVNHLVNRHHQSDKVTIQLAGIGIIPPLSTDPEYSYPATEPISYVNTYAALQNVNALFNAESEPVEIPVYSRALSETDDAVQSFETPGWTYTIQENPFDAFWLVSHDFLNQEGDTQQDMGEFPLADLLGDVSRLLPANKSHTDQIWSNTSQVSRLGSLGYCSVTVPHEDVQTLCTLRRERDECQQHLAEFVQPKLSTLQERISTLKSALEMGTEETPPVEEWLSPLVDRLEGTLGEDRPDLTEVDPETIESALDAVADQSDILWYMRCVLALKWTLTDGKAGAAVRSDVSKVVAEVRQNHEFDVLPEHKAQRMSLSERAEAVTQTLEGRLQKHIQSIEESQLTPRDIVPPAHELLTSDRERARADINAIESDLQSLTAAQNQLATLETLTELSVERVTEARQTVENTVEDLVLERQHFETEKAQRRAELDAIEHEIDALRHSLIDPEPGPEEIVLPLDRNALEAITLETATTELASIHDYVELGLLADDADKLVNRLITCYERSRDLPESSTRHQKPIPTNTAHDETIVFYHRDNEPLVDRAIHSFTAPDIVSSSADRDIEYTEQPYKIEMVSLSQKGTPETLLGFQQLATLRDDGLFETMAGKYRDWRRALAFPEWNDCGDAFD